MTNYINETMVNVSPYEFEVTPGLASSNYEGVRPVVNLRMSPQFAREFVTALQNNIAEYEKKFGKTK
jgi:DNA-dependent RNA polymerase auxiliary subunit epsilon